MANLNCSVSNCCYFQDNLCCKGDIMVGGQHACRKDDTCCDSFRERKGATFTSSTAKASPTVSIDCEAGQCVYNSNYRCQADHVEIKGCGACGCKETSCATFKEK